jgi:hypothetical protein
VVGSLLFGVAKKAAVQAAREWMEQRAY